LIEVAKRVFFSFHYQDVIDFRANVVRNHWVTKEGSEEAGFFDASLWENAKKRGPEALKQLINQGLTNTTVTCVLIGSQTYIRPWVRYEIFKSMRKGNRIIGVHINNIPDKYSKIKPLGPNPFEYLSIRYNDEGRIITTFEWINEKWEYFEKISGSANYTLNEPNAERKRKGFQLSNFYNTYNWINDNGYENFSKWVG
jgi:hypothetical protein